MTEKRYVLFNHKNTDYILDNPNTSLDFIEMLGDALSSEEIVNLLNKQDDKLKELLNSINNRIKFWEEIAKQDPSNIYFNRLLNDLKDLRRLYYE